MIEGIISLIPLIITIFIAVKMKDVILALYVGVITGVIILAQGNLTNTMNSLFGDYFSVILTDSYNVGVIILIMVIGGFIALMQFSHGANTFAKDVIKFLNTKAKAQISAYLFGILIFFSDLGTPLIVGPVFGPIFDKLKISRAKLAYIVDSTASPMAVIVPFTGWGVYIISLIDNEIANGTITGNSFDILVGAIGYQFYSLLTLITLPLVIYLGLNLFSMKTEEDKMQSSEYQAKAIKLEQEPTDHGHAMFIIIPLIVLFSVLGYGLYLMGFPKEQISGSGFRIVLSSAYLLASFTLMVLIALKKQDTLYNSYKAFIGGMSGSSQMVITLVGAWTLSLVIDNLHTADFIVEILSGNLNPIFYPALIFVTGTILSATTGSSWGTYAIITPFAIGLAATGDVDISLALGAILSGGLFGDHISPLSDTTILSAAGADCDLLTHVKTQIPYGAINAIVALIFYILAGIYTSYIWLLLAIITSIIVMVIIKKKEQV